MTSTRDPATENPAVGKDVEANGIRTNYLEAGSGDQNGRPRPRLRSGRHRVRELARGAARAGRATSTSSLRTWSVSATPTVPRDVAYRLDTLGRPDRRRHGRPRDREGPPVGNSFGGAIALRVTTRHPDRVDKLVLMGSVGVDFAITDGLDAVWGYDGTLEGMKKIMGYFAYDKSLTSGDLAQARYEGATQPGFQECVLDDVSRRRGSAGWTRSWLRGGDPELPHRTLIFHGREDQVIPLRNSYRCSELLDNADLAVFSHCGHWTQIERRDDFNRLARDFFLR